MFMYDEMLAIRNRPVNTVSDVVLYRGFAFLKTGQYYFVCSVKGTGKVLFTSRGVGQCELYCDYLLFWLNN